MIGPGRRLSQGLGRSRLFRSSLVTVYGIGLLLCLLTVAGAVVTPQMPSRWPVAAAFTAASAVIGWRLWLYRWTYITGGPPPARRLLLVFLPRALLALAGLPLALGGLGYIVISFVIGRNPEFQETFGGSAQTVMCLIGIVVMVLGCLFMLPLILALKGRRTPDSDIADVFSDENPTGEGTPPA